MALADLVITGSYELPLPADGRAGVAAAPTRLSGALPENLLVGNVLWFCRLRWIVIAVLIAFGDLGFFPGLLARLGMVSPGLWPFVTAGALIASNLVFLAHARMLTRATPRDGARVNLWAQIVGDLLVLTVVVHFVGSIETFVPFAYLLHIVLACIFFSRPAGLAVTGLACVLYVSCVLAEEAGVVPPAGIYAETSLRQYAAQTPGFIGLHVGSALAIWIVVWYLTSHLSAMVRRRDNELDEANRRLEQALEERARHMLDTTHQLKAPFAAIHANTQLLLEGHCGNLPTEALDVVRRIAARSKRLAQSIQEMLQLANLRSTSQELPPAVDVDLTEVLQWSLAQVQPMALQRHIAIDEQLQPTRTRAAEDHLRMLCTNVLSNAVNYSKESGHVSVRCYHDPADGHVVTIEDDGIGIPAEKLPHIFDEYYRTEEAVRHCKESSGLGLAIVRRVAELYGIRVRVQSQPGVGTQVELRFAPSEGNSQEIPKEEMQNGLRADR